MGDPEDLARMVAEEVLGGRVLSLTRLAGGAVGAVFELELEDAAVPVCVVKLTPWVDAPSFADEPTETRIYGARASNLRSARAVLEETGAPITGMLISGEWDGWQVVLMDAFEGVNLREALARGDVPDIEFLHGRAGDILGRLHAVTRAHQGWIEAPPVGAGWRTEFLEVFALHRARLRALGITEPSLMERLDARVERWAEVFEDPPSFALSHTDGVQAMAFYDGRWTITGLVDIEDYQFTDPRFALAGHELAVEFHGRAVPASFWEAYQAHVQVDPSFVALRPMFRAFYLTVWARVLKDDAGVSARCVELLEACLN